MTTVGRLAVGGLNSTALGLNRNSFALGFSLNVLLREQNTCAAHILYAFRLYRPKYTHSVTCESTK